MPIVNRFASLDVPLKREVKNVSGYIYTRAGRPSSLRMGLKAHLVENLEILLLLSGCRRTVRKCIGINQRPGRQSLLTNRSENHPLGRGHGVLVSCQV